MKASEFDSKKRMRLGIYARALTLVGVILTVATAGVTGWNIQDKRKILTVELERRIEALASHQAAAVANALWDLNRSGANSILHGLSQDLDFVTVRVTDDTSGGLSRNSRSRLSPRNWRFAPPTTSCWKILAAKW